MPKTMTNSKQQLRVWFNISLAKGYKTVKVSEQVALHAMMEDAVRLLRGKYTRHCFKISNQYAAMKFFIIDLALTK